MSEKEKQTEADKKVEGAFPKEDAKDTQPETQQPVANEKGTQLWAKDPNKDKKVEPALKPSQTDILLYQAREMHLLRLEIEAFLNKVYTQTQKPTAPVTNNATASAPAPIAAQPAAPATPKPEKLTQLETHLKEFLPELLEVNDTESNMFYVVRFKKFLGSENFAKISQVCRMLGGEYVSEGKKSHFNVPKADKQ
jgi:hypothetical protein